MIRRIAAGDIDAVARIYNHYVSHTVVSFEESPVSCDDMRARVAKVAAAGFPWLVVEQEDDVIGYAYASQWQARAAYRHTVEASVYLLHLHVGRGWGTRLYEALFAELKTASVRMVVGGVALPNPASIALHEKVGMVKVAHFREVGYKFGQWIDVAYWEKQL